MNYVQRTLAETSDYDLPSTVEKSIAVGSVTRADLNEFLDRRSLAKKRDGESLQQAWVRCYVDGDDPTGVKIWGLSKTLPVTDEAVDKADVRKPPMPETNPAFDLLNEAAKDFQKRNPALTREQCFDRIVTQTPAGQAWLREAKELDLLKQAVQSAE